MFDLNQIDYDRENDLELTFKIDEDFRFLYCKTCGVVKRGSDGNNSADYLFGKLCQYYFQTEIFALILDFYNLEYEHGDRLRKTINFFNQIGRDEHEKKNPIILIEPVDPKGIRSLIDWVKPKHLHIARDIEQSKNLAFNLFNQEFGS